MKLSCYFQTQQRSVFLSTKSKTFSKDDTLPKLPVPKLSDTIARYLQSVRPHVDDAAFEKTSAIARQFEATDGAKLHKLLLQRAEKEINWVSYYWDTYAYLTLRESLIPYYSMAGSCKREDMPWPPHSTQIQARESNK
jgi:carnitine O-octanoyltransferase